MQKTPAVFLKYKRKEMQFKKKQKKQRGKLKVIPCKRH